MDSEAIKKAAQHFVEARRSGVGCQPLPAELQPQTPEDGHAIQDATVAALSETIGGWKAGFDKAGVMTRAPILQRLIFDSPARLPAPSRPSLGIEAEIAFRFVHPLPPRGHAYAREEVVDAMEAFAAIELLTSRYAEPGKTSQLEKLADFIVNSGIVCAPTRRDWKAVDFSKLGVVLTVDGAEAMRQVGSHPTGDPIAPAVALANSLRASAGISAGQIVTTGTWTGVTSVTTARNVRVEFQDFAAAESEFMS